MNGKKGLLGNKGTIDIEQTVSMADMWIKREMHKLDVIADKVRPLPIEEITNSDNSNHSTPKRNKIER